MRYKNTKTGAVIDSSFNISGENWEEVKPGKVNEENGQEADENEGFVEEEVDLEEMKKTELIELAKEHEIEVNEKDTKAVIIETIAKAFE